MTFDRQSGLFENFRKTQSEIAVREIDNAHAARSKRTASSTASNVNS
jgi:hypothetical protein